MAGRKVWLVCLYACAFLTSGYTILCRTFDEPSYLSGLLQSELATQAGLTAALMGVLELLTPQHHVLLWRADCAVLGTGYRRTVAEFIDPLRELKPA
jgi:hypothetical protein